MQNNLLDKIMQHKLFVERPPVLVDVGASGKIHERWVAIAPYSTCIAFDGDDRELKSIKSTDSGYKELILYHRVLLAEKKEYSDFYLTRSPYCSSSLVPDLEALKPYSFRELFAVEKTTRIKSVTLSEILEENNIQYVDWFKTDSQGTDLRLFASLDNKIIQNVKIAEFEPGIIDAYKGEDKFHSLLQWFEGKNFFLDTLHLEYVHRIKPENIKKLKHGETSLQNMKMTPGWVNAVFLNDGKNCKQWDLRDALLFLVVCILSEQFGMIMEFAPVMQERFPGENLFDEILKFTVDRLDIEKRKSFRSWFKSKMHRAIDRFL